MARGRSGRPPRAQQAPAPTVASVAALPSHTLDKFAPDLPSTSALSKAILGVSFKCFPQCTAWHCGRDTNSIRPPSNRLRGLGPGRNVGRAGQFKGHPPFPLPDCPRSLPLPVSFAPSVFFSLFLSLSLFEMIGNRTRPIKKPHGRSARHRQSPFLSSVKRRQTRGRLFLLFCGLCVGNAVMFLP